MAVQQMVGQTVTLPGVHLSRCGGAAALDENACIIPVSTAKDVAVR